MLGLPDRRGSSIDHHLISRHPDDLATPTCGDHGPGIPGHFELEASPHERGVGEQERHCLPLHVRAHERAVGVIVFEEGDQRRRHRNELVRRHVHVVDDVRLEEREIAPLPTQDEFVDEVPLLIQRGVGLSDPDLFLVVGRKPVDLGRDPLVDHPTVRCLYEPEFVDPAVGRE